MVATRRQVQTGPDEEVVQEQDPDLLLKKKAGRKPAVKATTTTTKTEPKSRSVRGRKAEPEATVEEPARPATRGARTKKITVELDPAPIEDEKLPTARAAKATKTGSVRAKKDTAVIEETTSEVEPVVPRPTRATKSASVRGRKAASVVQEPVEEIAVQSKSAGVGSLRGRKAAAAAQEAVALPPPKTTRSTRGAAKATPLSPKKITQVNKASARISKQTNDKPAVKTTRSKAQVTAKPTGRKRTVSDENADVPDLDMGIEDVEDEQEVVVLASTPVKATTASRRGAKQSQPIAAAESEASMSSRPTTPSDSLVHSFNTVEEQVVTQEDVESASEVEQSGAEEGDVSEDELCGPKTPMKRSSPTAVARYQASIQRTIRKHEEDLRLETPVVRYAVLGTQQGTPQTQKPYCKPTAPASETRPMTVSRAAGRAFVFKDLRDGIPTLAGEADESLEEQDEPSFLPDEDIVPMDMVESEQNSSFFNTQSQPALEIDEAQLVASSLVEEDAEDYVVPANVQKYSDDPDDTVVIHDDDENMEAPSELPAQSFETEDTVIVTRAPSPVQEEHATDEEEEMDDGSVIIHSVQPSMKVESHWMATIAVNFDEHLNDVRASPRKQPVHPGIDSVNDATLGDDENADLLEPAQFDQDISIIHDVTRRQTLDLNMFIDMGALTEPTMHMQIETDEDQEAVAGVQASAEEEPHESHAPESEETSNVIELEQGSVFDNVLDDVQDATVSEAHDTLFTETNTNDQIEAPATHDSEDMEVDEEPEVPHYALPTIAFDARRKSLPVLSVRTPIRTGVRPNTSDGASMPRIANPLSNAWWARSGVQSTSTTPAKARPSNSAFNTPVRSRPSTAMASAVKTPKERYPLFPPKAAYSGHRNTVAAPVRFATPSKNSPRRRETFHKAATGKTITHIVDSVPSTPGAAPMATPKERYPALGSRENYEEHARTVAAPVRFQTPAKKSPNRRQTFHKALPGVNIESIATEEPEMATPVPKTPVPAPAITVQTPEEPATEQAVTTQERYPHLRPRQDYLGRYDEHAKTVAGPKRFNTPVKRSMNRPATVGKSTSLRFATIAASTPPSSYTPIKTPLKGPAMTPSQAPMTPHPAAPLKGIVALVEVFTLEGASASAPFISLLHRLGAKSTRSWNDRITHVVFKDGSPTTLQRVRLNNKGLEDTGKGAYIHCVNSRWVTDCDTEGVRVDESGDAYVVDVAEIPRGGKRRRKSMEPSALLNLGGNIVRDRKSSGGRVSSIGRSPAKIAEPVETSTPNSDAIGKENGSDVQSSPATPAWIAAPGELVQHTAPMKRVRKLDLPGKGEAKSRRLTFWNGAT